MHYAVPIVKLYIKMDQNDKSSLYLKKKKKKKKKKG